MNLRIELATRRDLESVIETRKSAILTDAPSAFPDEEVVAWAGKRKRLKSANKSGEVRSGWHAQAQAALRLGSELSMKRWRVCTSLRGIKD